MNLVFISGPVGDGTENHGARARDLRLIFPHIAAAGAAGAAAGLLLGELGAVAQTADPTSNAIASQLVFSLGAVVVAGLELAHRVSPLFERRRQVPRRWLLWRRRWLTAVAYGLVLGAGAFTHLRHATMYALALMVLSSPNHATAAVIGAAYGVRRGSTVLSAWYSIRRGSPKEQTLLRRPHLVLAMAALGLPAWVLLQLST